MFPSLSFRLPFFRGGGGTSSSSSGQRIELPSVALHAIETEAAPRGRTLKHLLKANHATYSVIYHELRFHNHMPHLLGSAYVLGGTKEHLNEVYDKEAGQLEPWVDSPGEVSGEDWREFLGARVYQRAFVDFFEDQLVLKRYDWKALLGEYMFGGEEPLVNGLVSGLGHPLIHLGYAYELNSSTLAIEALALAACFYSPVHKYLDDPAYTRPAPFGSTSPLELIQRLSADTRFDGLFDHGGADNIDKLFAEHEDLVLEYWNAWELSDPRQQFEDSQQAAVALLVATQEVGKEEFDFFAVHLLTTSHAVRILLPLVPARWHVSLVRQWWLFTLSVYIAQLRPKVELERITGYELEGRGWKFVVDKALKSEHALDAHFVKGLRAMKVASETWGDAHDFYLKAAVRFADSFTDWGGFAVTDADGDDVRYHY
ncbi:uncharacterized protein BDZ99DRAFT_395001 [Mytilinidion resinicola]|uniref:MGS207 protein n=1 Tax=Mytilinidion resinicola TaxID=574789 RepID=A0A6A6YAU6_9PEZI|nr:uncharacterized protein BDZ99DRAFT_395001 [Mytilinidion resinicola]KAF2805946.1 hypothetical protein BDZ99DRAFT_395001 [Mytilinidion resinicola]